MRLLLPAVLGLGLLAGPVLASPAPAGPVPNGPASPAESPASATKLRLLLDLVQDPDVRALLDARGAAPAAPSPSATAADTMSGGFGEDLQHLRQRIGALAQAVPRLPGEFGAARAMLGDMLGHGDALSLALFLPLFIALGFGGEWLFRLNTRRFGRWLLALPLDTVRDRISAMMARFAYGLGLIGSFTLGSVGAMLPFDWTAKFKQVLLALLLAAVVVRLAAVVGRLLLAPGAPRFRIVPIGTPEASYLFRRLVAAGLLLGIGSQLVALLASFGFDAESRELCRDTVEALALALGFATVARYPGVPTVGGTEGAAPAVGHADWRHMRAGWARLGLSLTMLLLWCFAVAGADKAFWVLVFAVGGPCTVAVAQRSIRHVMRPGGEAEGAVPAGGLLVVFLERGVRTLLIVAASALLARLIGLDVSNLAMHDTVATRITRAVIGVVVVVLVADFLWHVIVALIDRKLAGTLEPGDPADANGHAARLQTLLPITRNLSLAALVAVAGTMVLAALGVEIGPLIASAGVVGVAIGFGAQTLVKDIISGIFYLVDDAFRIGEYIQSGTYKGTVESFSLRSVKLRHQRGALFTIPFGTLGAVQNLSRDWVVDKIRLNVRYDTDLEQVRKIVKRIGETLAADPELGPGIIRPMKLQGVAQFGDYAVQLQTKMTTVPGDVQFASRRRALLLIKAAFQEHGIGFALPTVQVSGEGSEGAAAQSALTLVKAAEAAAAE
ncbi:mechanosensitive ion channel family protein [Lichenibacterium ramalinae]|uniref:Mechanosensitive ion channel family protein n=1 Tax=Lichenibacterium ramalinae TaxID=2316527 RepID=A0A4Q2RCZ2_9HYPH|nr:mechanosensitive ion channel family protein [Lichenibacterium ramalinae]RYB05576.1 mechanosensitive ion channel family protein [Lichenibacterium ramalinae]